MLLEMIRPTKSAVIFGLNTTFSNPVKAVEVLFIRVFKLTERTD